MEVLIEKLLDTATPEGIINSVLLTLIWLNMRGLKKVFKQIETDHEKRIMTLELHSRGG